MKTFEQRFIYFGLISIVLVITPFVSFEPNSQPKFLILVLLATIALLNIISKLNLSDLRNYRTPIFLAIAYLSIAILAFVLSPQPSIKQIYGIEGRNLGIATYISFIILFIFCIFNASSSMVDAVIKSVQICGTASAIIGLFQMAGVNLYQGSNLAYGLSVGFLGNPNFQSAFLGIALVLNFASLLDPAKHKKFVYFQIITSIIALYGTNSTQGYVLAIIGASIIVMYKLFTMKRIKSLILTTFIFSTLFLISIFAFLGKGPASSLLYQTSITYRGDYWRAAWNMIIQNPVAGLGFDSYRDNYRLYRDLSSVTRRGPEVVADSPHNVLLEAGVNGGLGLFLINILISIFILFTFAKYLKTNKSNNQLIIGLFAAWVAYTAQSIISLGNVALSLIGWIFGGLIIGLGLKPNNNTNLDSKNQKIRIRNKSQLLVGVLIGATIATPNFIYDARFASAYKSGNVNRIVTTVSNWPSDGYKMSRVVEILNANGFKIDALSLAKKNIELHPEVYEAWKTYLNITDISDPEKENILLKMRIMDPLNTNLLSPVKQ